MTDYEIEGMKHIINILRKNPHGKTVVGFYFDSDTPPNHIMSKESRLRNYLNILCKIGIAFKKRNGRYTFYYWDPERAMAKKEEEILRKEVESKQRLLAMLNGDTELLRKCA